MPTLTLANCHDRLARRFGGRTDLDTQMTEAINLAQQDLEYNAFLPWFLKYDTNDGTNLTTVASQQYLAPTTGFLREQEPVGLYILDSTDSTNYNALVKDDMAALMANDDYNGTGVPTHYALEGVNIQFFPTPDDAYTVRQLCYRADQTTLTNDADTNLWTQHAASLLIAAAGIIVAEELRYREQQQQFVQELAFHIDRLKRFSIAREEAGRSAHMGDS